MPQRRCSIARSRTCKDIEQHYPWYYPEEVRWAISAYALYTRKQLGDLDIAKGQKLLRECGGVDKITMETDGWLLGLFARQQDASRPSARQLVRYAMNHVSETAGAANFTTQLRRRRVSAARRAIAASTR